MLQKQLISNWIFGPLLVHISLLWSGVSQFTALCTRLNTALFLIENMKGFLSWNFMPVVNSP